MIKKNSDLTANKGEWSEIYALFALLADGNLYAADGKLKKKNGSILSHHKNNQRRN